MFRLKAQISSPQVAHRLGHQAGANGKHGGEHHLQDDEGRAQPVCVAVGRRAVPVSFNNP
jgi:hypothetical protein